MEAAGIHCVYLFNIRGGNSILTAGYYCFSFIKFISNCSYPIATVEELEEQIFDTITTLRNSKKQLKEDTIYCTISKTKTTKSLNKETLREALNNLVSSKKLKVKLHNGRNSHYIENDSFHEDRNKYQEIEDVKDLFRSDHETALP